ncbi:MAG: biosynthetic-type acetolactate synthase large subunit [Planctomycetota bacterium]
MTQAKLDGAQALVKRLEMEGVEYIWGLSGGAAIPIFDALVTTKTKIKLVLVRHEQAGAHMADGYARATGRPGVVLVTSGPGATNTITGIMTAHMDSVPMVVVTGQTVSSMLGKDAFQEADVYGLTMPIVKHSYLVKRTDDIPRIVREAFYIARTGRPGPVLIDIPKDVSSGPCAAPLDSEMDLPGYVPVPRFDRDEVAKAAEALRGSKRPVLLVGHGAIIANATREVRRLAETLRAPVTTTLLGKGAFPERHPLSLGMLGMHGTAYANKAMVECDLVLAIGSRFDDRIVGRPSKFCREAVRIHIDVDPAEIGKMVPVHHACVGDAKKILRKLIELVRPLDTAEWLERLEGYRKKYPLTYNHTGALKAQQILEELDRLTRGKAIVATDVGQHQMWAAQFVRTERPGCWISSGGAGTMGFGFPAALGAKFGRPSEDVWALVGDGGFQMTFYELATACVHKLGVKTIVFNNHYLGMVRQWQELFFEDRKCGVDLEGNPDFAALASAYPGALGLKLREPSEIRSVLRRAMEYNDGPCVIDAEVEKTDNVFPMIPAGKALDDVLVEPPRRRLEKPPGST